MLLLPEGIASDKKLANWMELPSPNGLHFVPIRKLVADHEWATEASKVSWDKVTDFHL